MTSWTRSLAPSFGQQPGYVGLGGARGDVQGGGDFGVGHAEAHHLEHIAFARCAATARDRLSDGLDSRRLGIPEQVPLDLLGLITGLPAEMAQIPWDGPQVRIVEHQAHSPGHAALLIEEHGVLVAGDMLSDVLIPMLDLDGTADPIEDYLAALRLLEGAAGDVDVLVPGHGSIGGADQVRARIDQDRAYVHAPAWRRRSRRPAGRPIGHVRQGLAARRARTATTAQPGSGYSRLRAELDVLAAALATTIDPAGPADSTLGAASLRVPLSPPSPKTTHPDGYHRLATARTQYRAN
jgi:glyoxylase-like metal-dependent hydrolase (beta-lactamase superfamily II)